MDNFGEKIRKLRESANLTQVKLAELAGVSEGTIVSAESSKSKRVNTVTYAAIVGALAKSLRISNDRVNKVLSGDVQNLAAGIADESTPMIIQEVTMDKFFDWFCSLPPEKRRNIHTALGALVPSPDAQNIRKPS